MLFHVKCGFGIWYGKVGIMCSQALCTLLPDSLLEGRTNRREAGMINVRRTINFQSVQTALMIHATRFCGAPADFRLCGVALVP